MIDNQFDVLDLVPVGAFVLQEEFTVLFWNRMMEDWTGILRATIVGQPIGDYFPHLQQPRYTSRLQNIFEGGPPTIFSSQLHKQLIASTHPNGRARIQHTTVTAVYDHFTSQFQALFVIQDVTELTHRIQGYRHMRDQALAEVAERQKTEEKLKAYATELERSNEALEEFAAVVSHDLKAPLRKVNMFGQRIQDRYNDILDERGKNYLDRMLRTVERMRTLIDGLLDYSQITTQPQPFVTVDLNIIVDEVLSDLEVQIADVLGQINVDPLPTIQADSMQMRQLWQNLIGNALKFHQPDTPPTINVTSEIFNDEATGEAYGRFAIADNGIGFDDKYVNRIFAAFQRLHGQDEYEGSGVGLAICHRIVTRHNGQISVKSEPNVGSTFTITLPLLQNQAQSIS